MSNVTETCKECGTEYMVSYGHKDCPKKKKEEKKKGDTNFDQVYIVTASAELHGVKVGVEWRVYEKDDVKQAQKEAFHLCRGTVQELQGDVK